MVNPNKFKDTMGRFRTQSLFFELKYEGYDPLFTLKDKDHEVAGVVYRSLRELYLMYADPTEYSFAMGVFGSLKCWYKIAGNKELSIYINQWREDLEVKLRSEGVMAIRDLATDEGSKSRLAAAKWLAEKGWEGKARGRPSKQELAKNSKTKTRVEEAISNDYERIFSKTVQ